MIRPLLVGPWSIELGPTNWQPIQSLWHKTSRLASLASLWLHFNGPTRTVALARLCTARNSAGAFGPWIWAVARSGSPWCEPRAEPISMTSCRHASKALELDGSISCSELDGTWKLKGYAWTTYGGGLIYRHPKEGNWALNVPFWRLLYFPLAFRFYCLIWSSVFHWMPPSWIELDCVGFIFPLVQESLGFQPHIRMFWYM